VFCDVRYWNEILAVVLRGGVVYELTRPGFEAANDEERRSFAEIREKCAELGVTIPVIENTTPREAADAIRRDLDNVARTSDQLGPVPMTLFLIGPSAGYFDGNRKGFTEAAGTLRGQGHTIIDPRQLDDARRRPAGRVYRALLDCDRVVLMPGWDRRSGPARSARRVGRLRHSRLPGFPR
jgi:hypothetical protein